MDKKKLEFLLKNSYKNGLLDEKRVFAIAKFLKRYELKKYINALKNYQNKNSLTIITPNKNTKIDTLENLFKDKNIIYQQDPSLTIGVKIINNDDIYEFNLKNILSNMENYVITKYD